MSRHKRLRNAGSNIPRRDWLRLAAMGVASGSMSGWLPALADRAAQDPKRHRACILLWMTGGPSQTDTFDLKPDHDNGGPTKAIRTSVTDVRISEHLPLLSRQMQHVVPIRSMSTKEGDHARATYLLRTGQLPQGPVHYPTLGSLLSKELDRGESDLPGYVSISPFKSLSPGAYLPGFLGPKHAPLVVGRGDTVNVTTAENDNYLQALRVRNLERPGDVDLAQADARLNLLGDLDADFVTRRPGPVGESHQTSYAAAVRMMRSEAVNAFTLDGEPDKLREAYGRNLFGQGCLLARRLVERGVPFVEVSLNGVQGNNTFAWDTHNNNFDGVKNLCGVLDPAWATLLADLNDRGLLDSTLVVWMGEFGRTPKINGNQGRDHFPNAWTTVLAGGGVRGGMSYGATSSDGMEVKDKPTTVPELIATIATALGIDPMKQNMSNVGRPIRIAGPEAKPIGEILL